MKPLAKWTIGETNHNGYECLAISIESFLRFYDFDVVVCHNCPKEKLPEYIQKYPLIDQKQHLKVGPKPKGVAWKLYPPRLDISKYEISIDNDLVINEKIALIDEFLNSKATLLLEENSRTYGRFDKHVPLGFQINSGLYGMPPNFDLEPYVKFYAGDAWEKNATGVHDKNETFDEQGLVALALLNHSSYFIISSDTITNCEHQLIQGKGHHFIGLNRRKHHAPFLLYKNQKLHL